MCSDYLRGALPTLYGGVGECANIDFYLRFIVLFYHTCRTLSRKNMCPANIGREGVLLMGEEGRIDKYFRQTP